MYPPDPMPDSECGYNDECPYCYGNPGLSPYTFDDGDVTQCGNCFAHIQINTCEDETVDGDMYSYLAYGSGDEPLPHRQAIHAQPTGEPRPTTMVMSWTMPETGVPPLLYRADSK